MHADIATIQRLAHGELAPDAAAELRAHLADCADCRSRWETFQAEEAEFARLLSRLDPPERTPDIAAVRSRAGQRGGAWRRIAATVLLTVGVASAAYALPGSPVRQWISAVREWVAGTPAPPRAPGPPEPVPAGAGIAVSAGDSLTVEITVARPGRELTVRLGEKPQVEARALAPGARFLTGPGRLTIDNAASPGNFELTLPQDAPWIEIRVAGDRLLLKHARQVEVATAAESTGVFRLPLAGGP